LTFAFDAKGRRIQKVVATNNAGTIIPVSTNKFLYDGWNLVAELKPNNAAIRTYAWGSDLSGSMQGAGGIGGLLEVSYYGGSATNCFPAFDGNGNLAALVSAADGTSVANYEYGPFGETVRMTGAIARNNPFRFSTKYQDDESDMLYYGYRYFKSSTGTWPNRDPKQEKGGKNLYCFVINTPITRTDRLGLNVNDPPNWSLNVCCCDDSTIQRGLVTLTSRWLAATKYLDDNGAKLDPEDKNGVSCVDSANNILSFMAPVPACWKCYIYERLWNYNPYNGDENSIRCDAVNKYGGFSQSVVFDWWYEKWAGYKRYTPISLAKYNVMFPWDPYLTGNPGAWFTADKPAPSDDCINKSPIAAGRIRFLKALLPPYVHGASN
jgi:RHS repeat-associated protein